MEKMYINNSFPKLVQRKVECFQDIREDEVTTENVSSATTEFSLFRSY